MIGSLEGTLLHLDPQGAIDQVIVTVGGVGYQVTVPAGVAPSQQGAACLLWIHPITRDDGTRLYGFGARADCQGFATLLNVPGVGAKVALSLIACLQWPGLLDALARGDTASLTRAEGVGRKLAERIVHEMGATALKLAGTAPSTGTTPSSSQDNEAVSALVNLGYTLADASKALQAVHDQNPDTNLEQRITLALRHLGGSGA